MTQIHPVETAWGVTATVLTPAAAAADPTASDAATKVAQAGNQTQLEAIDQTTLPPPPIQTSGFTPEMNLWLVRVHRKIGGSVSRSSGDLEALTGYPDTDSTALQALQGLGSIDALGWYSAVSPMPSRDLSLADMASLWEREAPYVPTNISGNAASVTVADAGGDTTCWVLLGTSQTGNLAPATDAGLTYDATANALTATTFIGNLTGNASGSSSSCTGNAATVTTNANLTGPITSTGNATAVASQTGTGTKFVMDTGPTIASPAFTGTVTFGTNVIRKVVQKTAIADNVATAVFTVTTTNETGSADGGCYSCIIKATITHSSSSSSGADAVVYGEYVFSRAMVGAGTGSNSAVEIIKQTASVATATATRDIGTITVTVAETTEYVQTISFQIDLTGTSVATANVTALVEVIYDGFLTPPAIA